MTYLKKGKLNKSNKFKRKLRELRAQKNAHNQLFGLGVELVSQSEQAKLLIITKKSVKNLF